MDEELKDSPPAHKLAYFLVDPCLRSDESDRVLQCDPQPSAVESERRSKTRTNLRRVGKIGPFVVYDLEYFFSGEEPAPSMRSVLVGTAPGELHEIDVQGNDDPYGELFPTEILDVQHGRQYVIKVKFDDGGNAHGVHEEYFVILEGVAILLDFTPVFDAASRIIPNGMMTYQPTSRFDLNSLVFHVQTELVDVNIGRKVACCEGRVEVPFQIEQGRVIAGIPRYFPEGPQAQLLLALRFARLQDDLDLVVPRIGTGTTRGVRNRATRSPARSVPGRLRRQNLRERCLSRSRTRAITAAWVSPGRMMFTSTIAAPRLLSWLSAMLRSIANASPSWSFDAQPVHKEDEVVLMTRA